MSITFCIATANNEREYVKLAIKSLTEHTKVDQHEILVFVDSDNQQTYDWLLQTKQQLPNLKVCKNTSGFPIGSQRNVSVMFSEAKNDVVCYLQSDMVVGKDFDKHILANIDENTVLSCARIEPPLHPPSPEKIVMDFGITPEEFKCDEFNKFVDELQQKQLPNIKCHFAPFAVYKSTWLNKLGGFDTQFRCSREDSDSMIRMKLCGLDTVQTWNACVYHFTCVSSRGKDWFAKTTEADYKNALQERADHQELKRFIRKWGFFGHDPKPVYDITFDIVLDQYVDFNLLKAVEPYCTRMYLSDANVTQQLISQLEFEAHYYSNLRWQYPDEYWKKVKHLFNPTDFSKRINCTDTKVGDVIVEFKYSNMVGSWKAVWSFVENIHQIVDSTEVGSYDAGFCILHVNSKNNLMHSMSKHKDIDLLLSQQEFKFS